MVYELKNKVALITGAATGIGSLVTRKLMDEGIKHVAVLDINEAAGVALQNELNGKYGANKVKFYKCDVTNEEQLLGCFDAVVKEQGNLDFLINNAGVMNDGRHIYKKAIKINVCAVVDGTLKGLDIMSKTNGGKGGTIINISSVVALHQASVFPIYNGSKSFVLQFSNCLGMEEYYSKTGVRILTICFGATDTPLLDPANVGNCLYKDFADKYLEELKGYEFQAPDNAAQGVIDVFKLGESGSTWISTTNRPVKDISESVKKAYGIMEKHVFE